VTASLQDESRKWITLLAIVCADETVLLPSLIYAAASGALQSTWVADVEAGKHDVFIISSPSGRTNNDIRLAWLEQVFNRCTKQKARRRRDYCLLVVDSHGSHLTMEFYEFCHTHQILLAVLTPHSTHTLQPLDIVMFKPLSTAYTKQLSLYFQRSQGLVPIKKGDFFPLFWEALRALFKKETVFKSFAATGIWPLDAEVIIKHFCKTAPQQAQSTFSLTPNDWHEIEHLVRTAVKDTTAGDAKQLSLTLHHLQVQNELLNHENHGLCKALSSKKKHSKKSKALDLQQRQEYHGGAIFWSPCKLREAQVQEEVKQHIYNKEQLQKAETKKLKEAAALYTKKMRKRSV
jgi:hypothetical protein